GESGSGKTTIGRCILRLLEPTKGAIRFDGEDVTKLDARAMRAKRKEMQIIFQDPYASLNPRMTVGDIIAEPLQIHTDLARAEQRHRVGEVLELVGLTEVAKKRSKGFSLGMGQRLGIAAALLGDPAILMFDEPVNGLDPEGILWIRNLMKALAAQGRTVFVSSHLMSEMENTADHLIVIGRGKLIADGTVQDFIAANSQQSVRVKSPQRDQLAAAATDAGATVRDDEDGTLVLLGMTTAQVGDLAFENNIRLHELAPAQASLEQAFMELTAASVEFHAGIPLGSGRETAAAGTGAGSASAGEVA
ncbi:MAG TPA: ABC transporter ATP-binding protein, partial [Streptosporangiaceae bacterium]|nr:ABC transporter ATP-binding protein [Streptosporangiaceae bacterium]